MLGRMFGVSQSAAGIADALSPALASNACLAVASRPDLNTTPSHRLRMPAPDPIQAYYKLSFPNFEYYLQTLSVTIGRRPYPTQPPPPDPPLSPHGGAHTSNDVPQDDKAEGGVSCADENSGLNAVIVSSEELDESSMNVPGTSKAHELANTSDLRQSPHPSTSSGRRSRRSHSSSAFPHVDVDLGPLKSVSRLHARIDYDDSIDKFVLYVNGRNGAWVDDQWVGCGGRVALGVRTKIQISTRTFFFVLPPPPVAPPPLSPETTPGVEPEQTSAEDHASPPSPPRSRRRSRNRSASRSISPPKAKRRRLSPDASSSQPPSSPVVDKSSPSFPVSDTRHGQASSKASSSRNHPPRVPTHHLPYPPDDVGSDDEQLVSINDLEEDELDELRAIPIDPPSDGEQVTEKGKVKGMNKVRKPRTSVMKGPLLPSDPSTSSPAPQTSLLPIRPLPARAPKGIPAPTPDPSKPRQPKKYMTQRVIAKAQLMQMPRPPPDKMPPKPPFTYAILCFRAIQELGGKASLSEIVNWIRDKYEWYRWNDECGWESSVRHNLSSNPGFVKSRRDAEVERIVITTGQQKKIKGFFWSVDPKAMESFQEKEKEIIEAGSRAKAQQKAKGKEDAPSGIGNGCGPDIMSKGVGHTPASARPAVPVPMMAPRGIPGQPPPPPVGMSLNPQVHLPAPHMIPPMMAAPSALPIPTPTTTASLTTPSAAKLPITPQVPSPSLPQALPDVCLSITVGPPPPGANVDTFSSPYVDGPPITLHNGALFLNPTIFAGLSKEQLEELQKLKAEKALEILTGYTKNYVKEQIVKKGKAKAKAKAASKQKSASSGDGGSVSDKAQPATTTDAASGESGSSSMPTSSPAASSTEVDTASILAVATLAAASSGPSAPAPLAQSASVHHPPALPPPYAYYPFGYQGGWAYPSGPNLPLSPVVHFPPSHPPSGHAYIPFQMQGAPKSTILPQMPRADNVVDTGVKSEVASTTTDG
ncbi:Pre-rRNA-processing protein fhl1 [Tulasnella sp. 403]|nr:Pre-rRNA-processing protein fhl1 [Tulasnella sp. 403]